jgi:hypothetical protein
MGTVGGPRRAIAVAAMTCALVGTGVASAQETERGIDPNQGKSLVEISLSSKGAAMRLQLEADKYGVEFNDHYLRRNADGSVVVSVFGGDDEIDALADAGYDVGATIEGPAIWRERVADRQAAVREENRAEAVAEGDSIGIQSHQEEVVILRADYFENRDGRFLSVEAKTRNGDAAPTGSTYVGPTLALSWNDGAGTPINNQARVMSTNIDPDTTPDTYIEHRELVRIGEPGTTSPPRPTRIRVGSSDGGSAEGDVQTWLGGGLPPMGTTFQKGFTTRYLDPTELYAEFGKLAAEYPNIAELIPLPHKTNGYQRRAQATMAGATGPGSTPPDTAAARSGAVVLTSRAWGHEGGNAITAEFLNPGVASSALDVSVSGTDITVRLATNASNQLSSTGTQVVDAINADPDARQLVVANRFTRENNTPFTPGAGIVQPRSRVPLSDFLNTAMNGHVKRGPFEYSVMRIGKEKNRDGSKVGVFLYCQQHAREWATPLTCFETAKQLLVNYATDEHTRDLVNNLDIFILPSSNPDGAHFSMHNFTMQRRNLTNHCVVGGKETDDPFAADFWQARTPFGSTTPYTAIDPAARQAWGVDLNRNNTVGTFFDGYIGASSSCISDVFAGPSEASEPEIRNEHWIADTFTNIKFSNNIHSFGGYFMWAPGAYLPNRDEGDLEHANIGVEKYFFAAGDQILNRIKEHRNTVILPERTGPIADVLYSAGGNSADEHWYKRDVIAYSFETGADLFFLNTNQASTASSIRFPFTGGGVAYLKPGDTLRIGADGPNEETRTVASVTRVGNNAVVALTQALASSHPSGTRVEGAALQTGVGFQPEYAEGEAEALEFAAGNYGLLESAYAYAHDRRAPQVRMTGATRSSQPIDATFVFGEEPAVIRYTTDGSTPTESSTAWDSTGPREPGEVFHITETTTFKWMATDIKGNRSFGERTFTIVPG